VRRAGQYRGQNPSVRWSCPAAEPVAAAAERHAHRQEEPQILERSPQKKPLWWPDTAAPFWNSAEAGPGGIPVGPWQVVSDARAAWTPPNSEGVAVVASGGAAAAVLGEEGVMFATGW